jgi:hypothetical protein
LEIPCGRTATDAYELFELARRKDARISLRTVYRALAYFRTQRDPGPHFGEGHPTSRTTTPRRNPAHFICTRCGKVREVKGKFIRDMEALARGSDSGSRGASDLFGLRITRPGEAAEIGIVRSGTWRRRIDSRIGNAGTAVNRKGDTGTCSTPLPPCGELASESSSCRA